MNVTTVESEVAKRVVIGVIPIKNIYALWAYICYRKRQ